MLDVRFLICGVGFLNPQKIKSDNLKTNFYEKSLAFSTDFIPF
jgi:hypothetical protein